MKRFLALILVAAMAGLSGCATSGGGGMDEDLSWWGTSGSTPGPVKDATRSGYWWWPTEPASNVGDSELWGNRGLVYSSYAPTPPPPPPAPPAPVDPPAAPAPPTVTRTVPVFNNVLFDFDKSTLKPEGRMEIDKVVAGLKQNSSDTVRLVGHTDSMNRSGDPNYNVKLGQRRADAVSKYLTDNGVATSRVSTSSRGAKEPAVANDTAANRALNRRVIFHYSISN